jgi:hypothetical protein
VRKGDGSTACLFPSNRLGQFCGIFHYCPWGSGSTRVEQTHRFSAPEKRSQEAKDKWQLQLEVMAAFRYISPRDSSKRTKLAEQKQDGDGITEISWRRKVSEYRGVGGFRVCTQSYLITWNLITEV